MATVADSLGWVATALFVSSYFFARAESLKRVQVAAAALWVSYGLLTHALPVVASNALLIGVAAWTIARRAERGAGVPASEAPGGAPGSPPSR